MDKHVVLTSLQDLSPVLEECFAVGSEIVITVTGNSMRPLLRHRRDQVVLCRSESADLRIGDVPLYRRPNGQFVLHRVVGLGASSYTMCGDGQWEKEYGVSNRAIVAIAKGFYRRGKYISCDGFWYTLYWKLWLVCLPIRPFILRGGSLIKRAVRRMCGIFKKKET